MLHSREKLLKHTQICFPVWLFILYILNTRIIIPGLAESVRFLKVQLQSQLNSPPMEGVRNAECRNRPSGKNTALVAKIYKKQLLLVANIQGCNESCLAINIKLKGKEGGADRGRHLKPSNSSSSQLRLFPSCIRWVNAKEKSRCSLSALRHGPQCRFLSPFCCALFPVESMRPCTHLNQ